MYFLWFFASVLFEMHTQITMILSSKLSKKNCWTFPLWTPQQTSEPPPCKERATRATKGHGSHGTIIFCFKQNTIEIFHAVFASK